MCRQGPQQSRVASASAQILDEEVEIAKSNVLMLGPTGCGKTLMAKVIAKMVGVPVAVADATALTQVTLKSSHALLASRQTL